MKRFIICTFLCMLLCSCGTQTKNVSERTQQSNSVSNSAVALSESPFKTGIPIVMNSPIPNINMANSGENKLVFVTDMTGKKSKLKIGNVDVRDEGGVEFSQIRATAAYSQVVDNHYYFMRSDGKRNYTVYRDKGKKVGTFSLKNGFVEYCALYNKKIFVLIRELSHDKKCDESFNLVEIDLKKKRMREICNCLTDLEMGGKMEDDLTPIGLYQGMYLYLYDNDTKLGRFDLKRKKLIHSKKKDPMIIRKGSSYSGESWNWLCFGGKIYYAVRYEDHVVIYSLDIKSGVRKEVFRFNCVDVFGQPEKFEDNYTEAIGLDIDEDYIYCQGYGIPRRGGEMVRLFRYEKTTLKQPPYAHNKQFVYYIYEGGILRRIDKETLESKVIWDRAVMDVKCTKNGLFVQSYDSSVSLDYFNDNSDEDYFEEQTSDIADSCDLYYMDFNGENEKQIWKGKESR